MHHRRVACRLPSRPSTAVRDRADVRGPALTRIRPTLFRTGLFDIESDTPFNTVLTCTESRTVVSDIEFDTRSLHCCIGRVDTPACVNGYASGVRGSRSRGAHRRTWVSPDGAQGRRRLAAAELGPEVFWIPGTDVSQAVRAICLCTIRSRAHSVSTSDRCTRTENRTVHRREFWPSAWEADRDTKMTLAATETPSEQSGSDAGLNLVQTRPT